MTGTRLRFLALTRKFVYWSQAKLIFAIMAILRLLPPSGALTFLAWAGRKLGPWLGRHRVALGNLALAMPEKSLAEQEAIAGDMWENMSRLVGEYIFLDDLFDFDPARPTDGRIEIEGIDLFIKLREDKNPKIFFTAHMGNFELLPIAAAAFDLNVTAMFRPPNNPYVAERVLGARKTRSGHLVPSKAGASISLARILENGGNIGVLVDQKFINGLDTTFFGAACQTSPLVAKLARQFNCDIYPAFCIRLPGGRFRLTLQDKLPIPIGSNGKIDQVALTQAINDHVENWVRTNPGQWMWFHKRWQIARTR